MSTQPNQQSVGHSQTGFCGARVFATGFALFAMFFGAGNLIFPLYLGAHAGSELWLTALAFIVIGVGTPMLGLFATSLYKGDYWAFFGRLGKVPCAVVITFLMLVIGPFFAAPRTEVITYETLKPFLSGVFADPWFFSLLFFIVVFLCSWREGKVVDVIGYWITPIKLFSFTTLIVLGVILSRNLIPPSAHSPHIVRDAISMSYGTMDMLAAFFFATIGYRAITARIDSNLDEATFAQLAAKRMLAACIIAAVLLGLVYLGFMVTAYAHAASLQHVAQESILHAVALEVLGNFGSEFVGVCVTFACLATTIALTDVTSTYVYEHVIMKAIPRVVCMVFVLVLMFFMSQLGFEGIMRIAYPMLVIVYPALIVLCVVNILHKKIGFPYVKIPVAAAACLAILYSLIWTNWPLS